jgi:hypothetical protein
MLERINKYKVFIAALSNREYSITATISVIRDILYSFLNIKIGLVTIKVWSMKRLVLYSRRNRLDVNAPGL